MPRATTPTLIWSPENGTYELHVHDSVKLQFLSAETEDWFAWLAACSSFAFQGKASHLTLRNESRLGRERYWYA